MLLKQYRRQKNKEVICRPWSVLVKTVPLVLSTVRGRRPKKKFGMPIYLLYTELHDASNDAKR